MDRGYLMMRISDASFTDPTICQVDVDLFNFVFNVTFVL